MLDLYPSTVCEFPDFLFKFFVQHTLPLFFFAFSKTDVIGPALIFNFSCGPKIVLLRKTNFYSTSHQFSQYLDLFKVIFYFLPWDSSPFFTTIWRIFLLLFQPP